MLSVEEIEETVKKAIEEFNKENEKVEAYIHTIYHVDYEYSLTYNLPFKDAEVCEVIIRPKPNYINRHVRVNIYLPLEPPNTIYTIYNHSIFPERIEFSNKEEAKVKLKKVLNKVYKHNKDKLELPKGLLDLLEKIKEMVGDFDFYVEDYGYEFEAWVKIYDIKLSIWIKDTFKGWRVFGCRIVLNDKDDLFDIKRDAILRYLELNNIKFDDYFKSEITIDLSNVEVGEDLNILRKIIEAVISIYLI